MGCIGWPADYKDGGCTMKRFCDFLRSLFEWVAVVGWWLLAVGLIVGGSVIEHLIIVV